MSRIVITGASSGLGQEIKFALQGDNAQTTHEVLDFSYPVYDVRSPIDCEAFLDHHCPPGEKRKRSIDVLINCAGVSPLSFIENAKDEDWNAIMDTNCKGIFNMTRAAIPYLSARGPDGRKYRPFDKSEGGTIINIGSTAAWTPMTCTHIYNASKAAVHMMTRQMARELKPRHGIDVFAIAPNVLEGTGISNSVKSQVPGLRGWTEEEAEAKQASMIPNGVPTPPKAVAEFIAFLLQNKERHKYLTGCIIPYGA